MALVESLMAILSACCVNGEEFVIGRQSADTNPKPQLVAALRKMVEVRNAVGELNRMHEYGA
jgi:hypothetical protein